MAAQQAVGARSEGGPDGAHRHRFVGDVEDGRRRPGILVVRQSDPTPQPGERLSRSPGGGEDPGRATRRDEVARQAHRRHADRRTFEIEPTVLVGGETGHPRGKAQDRRRLGGIHPAELGQHGPHVGPGATEPLPPMRPGRQPLLEVGHPYEASSAGGRPIRAARRRASWPTPTRVAEVWLRCHSEPST